ncbi:MAG: hypothetical protein GQ527_03035, partial [Bacteroidales bacterium]|nr:hypothetical protein [Bacteroidales bacterium]
KKEFLSRAELDILERMLDIVEPHYVPHLEKFLFGCYTGLRVSDLGRVKKSDLKKEKDGWELYLHRMYKVDKEVLLPLHSLFGGRWIFRFEPCHPFRFIRARHFGLTVPLFSVLTVPVFRF